MLKGIHVVDWRLLSGDCWSQVPVDNGISRLLHTVPRQGQHWAAVWTRVAVVLPHRSSGRGGADQQKESILKRCLAGIPAWNGIDWLLGVRHAVAGS